VSLFYSRDFTDPELIGRVRESMLRFKARIVKRETPRVADRSRIVGEIYSLGGRDTLPISSVSVSRERVRTA